MRHFFGVGANNEKSGVCRGRKQKSLQAIYISPELQCKEQISHR